MCELESKSWPYKTVLITGGTGTFGVAFLEDFLTKHPTFKIRLFSRDEFKQANLRARFGHIANVSFLLGDVRDTDRLMLAFHGVDLVIHAAALKHVPLSEYNPFEAVQTNIIGTWNVIRACLMTGVRQAIFLSSDKAVSPINLYGATKMTAEKLIVQANNYSADTLFGVVRYGNVMGSRGSVLEIFEKALTHHKPLPLTTPDMTRFYLHISDAVELVRRAALMELRGGILIPHLQAFDLTDLARACLGMSENDPLEDFVHFTGIRAGEKVHEQLISPEEVSRCLVSQEGQPIAYCVAPSIHDWSSFSFGKPLTKNSEEFQQVGKLGAEQLVKYDSGLWPWRLNVEQLKEFL